MGSLTSTPMNAPLRFEHANIFTTLNHQCNIHKPWQASHMLIQYFFCLILYLFFKITIAPHTKFIVELNVELDGVF